MVLRRVIALGVLATGPGVAQGAGAAAQSAPQSAAPAREEALVIEGTTVVDVRDGTLRPKQTVVLVGSRIRAVGRAGRVRIPAGARVVRAEGTYLIPGLWDMHIHPMCQSRTFYPLLVAHGITGIRDAGSPVALETLLHERHEIAAGTRVGPRLVVAGPYLSSFEEGVDSQSCGTKVLGPKVSSPAEARRWVDSLAAAGADHIKMHIFNDTTGTAIYYAAAAAARRRGVLFGGHLAGGVTAGDAADSGAAIIDHGWAIDECYTDTSAVLARKCAETVARLRQHNTWVEMELAQFALPDPSVTEYWADSVLRRAAWFDVAGHFAANRHMQGSEGMARQMRPAVRAGLPIVAGTDGAPFGPYFAGIPGHALHATLESLVRLGGMSPLQALQTATLNPAHALRAADSLGTVERGKVADLVLLDANPLADITNTRKIAAVVADGRYFSRRDLDAVLDEVRGRAKGSAGAP